MKRIRRIICLLSIIGMLFIVSSCNSKLAFTNIGIIHEPEFGGVYIKVTIDEFNNKGFEYGDSVDVEFTNGYKVSNLPYYNGYYVDAGESLLVGYPGYDYIKLAINYGDDYWDIAKLNDNDKATVRLNAKGLYKDIQNTMNIQYKDVRSEYETDEEFGNYRMINNGNIKADILYRGASPCDNKHNRAPYVDKLIEADGVNFIIDLADTPDKIEEYISKSDFNSPYFLSLYRRNTVLLAAPKEKIMPLSMNMNYKSDEFRAKVSEGFRQILNFNGPYYIHCQEGKDRTGFVCIVIEALCGATYEELVYDYMYTYKNYYKITKESDQLRYNVLKTRNVDTMLRFLVGDSSAKLEDMSFSSYIKDYLIKGGLTAQEVDSLITKLTK